MTLTPAAKRFVVIIGLLALTACDVVPTPGDTTPRVEALLAPTSHVGRDFISARLRLPNADVDVLTLRDNVVLLKDGEIIAGTAEADGDTLSFVPDAVLDGLADYTLRVSDGLKDLSGQRFAPYEQRFTTSGPSVLRRRIDPRPGLPGVLTNVTIQIDPVLHQDGVVDLTSLTDDTLYLEDIATGQRLRGEANSNAGGTVINYRPEGILKTFTRYRLVLTDGVKDTNGRPFAPFTMEFETGEDADISDTFRVEQVFTGNQGETVSYLAIGADGKLYGSSLEGIIRRWTIDPISGRLSDLQTLALPELAGRSIIGITFDPSDRNVLWIAHNDPVFVTPACDFTSGVGRIRLGTGLTFSGTFEPYVTGLPRSSGDHFSNGLAFNPAGDKLYLTHGSNNSHGGTPDASWLNRPERLLSAAILEIDPRRPASQLPINVQTDPFNSSDPSFISRCQPTNGSYNPNAANAPVTVYASGLRNAYDLVWHSNGSLYAPVNGPNDGGTTPAIPGTSVGAIGNGDTAADFLVRAEAGRYYGHPNPARDEYVMNGGNPTSGSDPYEYSKYPPGTQPDPNWQQPVFNLGLKKSVNGIIEYTSNNKYRSHLITAQFAVASVIALEVAPDGSIRSAEPLVNPIGFPLALVENPRTGDIYVAELNREAPGRGQISLLTPNQ